MRKRLCPWLEKDTFHLGWDLGALVHMIKVMSMRLSEEARDRLRWMDAYRECHNARLVCRRFGIASRTFWWWKKRYDPWDLTSLECRSRRPKTRPKKTSWHVERLILGLKKDHPRAGRRKIAAYLKRDHGVVLHERTVGRILTRHALNIRYRTRKRKTPKPRVDMAQVRVPGDLLQMDTKFVSLQGRRVFQYTIIDVTSRKRHIDVFPDSTMETTCQFLADALAIFPFKAKQLQTDNGHEFGQSVTKWLKDRNIHHVFSHKRRPQENAYVERSHRTDEEEFYSLGKMGSSLPELRSNLKNYLHYYNHIRIHWGLDGKTPDEALADYSLTEVCNMS
jgi:transposase InsO family protein